jgi:hypothetical protein
VPLYLVRWPDLSGAFVNARNEDDLLDILDEISNPEGCTWRVYRGPLHLEFRLNADVEDTRDESRIDRPVEPADLRIGSVGRICAGDPLTFEIPDSDTGCEMIDAILGAAFPALQDVRKKAEGDDLSKEAVIAALRKELDVLVQASWREQQTKRRPDTESRIAAEMGTSPRLVAHWRQRASAAEGHRTPKPPTDGGKGGTKRKKVSRARPGPGKRK